MPLVTPSRMARASTAVMKLFSEGVIPSKAGRCEHDNSCNTHLAARLGLFQAHYINDDWLVEDIRKQKRETIWESALSFLLSRVNRRFPNLDITFRLVDSITC